FRKAISFSFQKANQPDPKTEPAVQSGFYVLDSGKIELGFVQIEHLLTFVLQVNDNCVLWILRGERIVFF
ncbi:MAG TPA: hypothetical protein PK509_18325, partial [Catalimonadaceae bacterium]|nr:hypothetical protein [Catalimonadaceae bacterium]